jgi:hypothetical protein
MWPRRACFLAHYAVVLGAGPGLGRGTRLNLTRIRAEPKVEPAVQLLERSRSKSCPTPPKGAPVIAAMCGYALAHSTTVEVAYPHGKPLGTKFRPCGNGMRKKQKEYN